MCNIVIPLIESIYRASGLDVKLSSLLHLRELTYFFDGYSTRNSSMIHPHKLSKEVELERYFCCPSHWHTVAVNKKLTFSSIVRSFWGENVSVCTLLCGTGKYARARIHRFYVRANTWYVWPYCNNWPFSMRHGRNELSRSREQRRSTANSRTDPIM